MKGLLLPAMFLLASCGQTTNSIAPREKNKQVYRIPRDQSTGFRDGYSLRVRRTGQGEWNGTTVNAAELIQYLHDFAALPRNAGSIYVAFEPGLSFQRVEAVRRAVIDSGLCQQSRCLEESWNVQRPGIN